MPYIVQELIEDNPPLVTARAEDRVQDALATMFEHEFSQLPVVDEGGKPIGIITNESILRALNNFEVGLDSILVGHAQIGAEKFREDADLFELLDRLSAKYAVLIVDGAGRLIGIVTNYDTARFFRRRAQDMMLIEDIETTLKDYIQAAYSDAAGEINEERLTQAVQRMTDTVSRERRTFKKAVSHYLSATSDQGTHPDQATLRQVIEQHYKEPDAPKTFDDLNLSQYVDLLLDSDTWPKYAGAFKLERGAVRKLMDKVRNTRNALAHFRGEITSAQREGLHFCADWLNRYQDAISAQFKSGGVCRESGSQIAHVSTVCETPTEYEIESDPGADIVPMEADAAPNESRYAPLAVWLQNQPATSRTVDLSFHNVEDIINGLLPSSARAHRSWWANDTVGHVQSQQWLEVGWAVMSVNMSAQTVRFTRIKERERAYINFYRELLNELSKQPGFADIAIAPLGLNWNRVHRLDVGDTHVGMIGFAFGRSRIFRIELYIDSGDGDMNDQLFQALQAEKEEIETELATELLWQPLQNRRASRVAQVYSEYAITDEKERLAALRRRAVPDMTRFTTVIVPRVKKSIVRIQQSNG